jgi:hypothetical protein
MEAGYDPFPAAELAIRALYDKKHPEGYPPMKERIEIVTNARDYIVARQPFFDNATMLLTIGRYHLAARVFESLARDFQSRELLNNAGVAYALTTLAIEPRPVYHYPFEIDTAWRYPSRSKGEEPVDQEVVRRDLLTRAADLLDRALRIDPEYATARLNRACVAELLGTREELVYHLSKARNQAARRVDETMLARLQILEGIDLSRQGKDADAADLFTAAQSKAESMAISNLLAIRAKPKLPPPPFAPDNEVKETVANLTSGEAMQIPSAPSSNKQLELSDQFDISVKLSFIGNDKGKWDAAKLQAGKLTVTTISTRPEYAAASKRGVRIGESESVVTGRYGRPDRVIATRTGNFLFYEQDSIIFKIDREKVSGWTLFKSEERK